MKIIQNYVYAKYVLNTNTKKHSDFLYQNIY